MAVTLTENEETPLLSNTYNHQELQKGPIEQVIAVQEETKLDGDVHLPQNWSKARKWRITCALAFLAFTFNFTCISIVPIAGTIVNDLSDGHADKSASVLLVTIWELGEAAGPLILAPLSEMYGRRPVLNVANVLLVAAVGLATVSPSTTIFIATRALCGLVVTCNVLNPAIMGDMWDPVSRGSPMSLITLCQFAGGSAGPLLGSLIADKFHWRWVMGMNVGLAVICTVLLYTCYQETYLPVIHHRQLQQLHKSAENGMASTLDGKKRGFTELVESVTRPIIVFASSGVLVSMSLFGGISFSHYYNMATTLPGILQDQYGLSSSLTGLAFIFFTAGSILGSYICNALLDRTYIKLRSANGGVGRPEFRLPLLIVAAFIQPVAIGAYGWIAHFSLPLPLLWVAIGFKGVVMTLVLLPLFGYVVDAFGLYSASALTGVIVSRCLISTFLPLTSTPLIDNLGYGLGFTIHVAFSACLIPVPILVMKYGHRWRQVSVYSRDR